jgi:hypothetical protein
MGVGEGVGEGVADEQVRREKNNKEFILFPLNL